MKTIKQFLVLITISIIFSYQNLETKTDEQNEKINFDLSERLANVIPFNML